MSKGTILCVDDELSILKSLSRCLTFAGYDVISALGGEEGLRQLTQAGDRLGLMIIDQRMPGISGDEFLGRIKDLCPGVPVIILTGHVDLEGLEGALAAGHICRCMAKPWDNADLLRVVDEIFQSSTNGGS